MARRGRKVTAADLANQASGKAAGDAFRAVMNEGKKRVNQVMRATGIEATRRIVLRTPVDTGRARANWNPSKDVVDDSTKSVIEVDPSGNASVTAARSVVKDCDFFAGDVFYVSNGLPYIRALENGTSKQAPAGMVSVTMGEIRVFADQVAANLENADRDRENG